MEMTMVLQQEQRGRRSNGGGGVCSSRASSTTSSATVAKPPPPRRQEEREEEDEAAGAELRRGPWTVDEDLVLVNYIAEHGEGRWNALARAAGLKRTGKSCRLRWLNYLRPDVKRGDFTADEQLLILDLHSRWGNRWSKIAQQLPGRTDNEIKNYWRTRVQKHARQLGCDVASRRFRDAMTYLWMPRLAERATHQHSVVVAGDPAATASSCLSASLTTTTTTTTTESSTPCFAENNNNNYHHSPGGGVQVPSSSSSDSSLTSTESSTSAAAAHEEKSALHNLQHHHHGVVEDCGGSWTTSTMMTQLGAAADADHEEFWSSTVAPELSDLQDLTGWVQGFSDHHSLWSLDDIWRMH